MAVPPFQWMTPRSVAEASSASSGTLVDAMLAPGDKPFDAALPKAGGLDLLDLMKEGLVQPRQLVNLRGIAELEGIGETGDGGARIGAMATLAQIAGHPLIGRRYGALAEAAGGAASPQIRHLATLGGNLLQRPHCWYFRSLEQRCLRKGGNTCFAQRGENKYHAIFGNSLCAIVHPSTTATALVALGARIDIAKTGRPIHRMLLEDFLIVPELDPHRENSLKPGEIITAILLPPLPAGSSSVYLRICEKAAFDWPLADVAVLLQRDAEGRCQRAEIVLGAVAPVPHRARAAEQMLTSRMIDGDLAQAAGQAAPEGDHPAHRQPIQRTDLRDPRRPSGHAGGSGGSPACARSTTLGYSMSLAGR